MIDLGDDVPEPVTTTPKPPLSLYTIDTKQDLKDLEEFTEISCNYQDHADEFWTWGCPQEVDDNGGFGYWTACHTSQCDFVFTSGKDRPKVKRVKLDGIFTTGGIVSLSKKDQKFGSVYSTVVSMEMINDRPSMEFTLDQDCDNEVNGLIRTGYFSTFVFAKIFLCFICSFITSASQLIKVL